jgi:hypothetical protein
MYSQKGLPALFAAKQSQSKLRLCSQNQGVQHALILAVRPWTAMTDFLLVRQF